MSKGKTQVENVRSNSNEITFPVAGIGASAGGLEAIRKLLENLPENTGLAFVVVQHLAAGQESMLTEILSRSTKMPVSQVQNEMQVEPNQVYVIPPGKTMTISKGILKLQPKELAFKPIDEFFRSLAIDRKTQAIGIVLSGTGTDGTEGLRFIKAEGGITFAQDPKSSQYPDMPKSAIAAETVYFILPPEQIAAELSRIAKHPEIVRQKMEAAEPKDQDETNTETIFTLLKASFGVNFTNYKKSTTSRRITRRMVLNKIETMKKYTAYLRTHKEELQALFDDLLIGVTGFFREPKTFALLKEEVFPNILDKKLASQPIRIWIPGCSTGEEVYSVAIVVEEFLEEKNNLEMQIQIFGTDVNEKNIEKARKGIYLKNIEESVPENQLKRFFAPSNGNYQVAKQIRDMCVFAKHDITKDPPFSNLNLIICRNLLIYFDSKLQERIIPLFHYGLKPNGFIVLGEAESIGKYTYLFEPATKKGVVFRKKISQPNFDLQLEAPTPRSTGKLVEKPERADYVALLEKQVDHILMADYVPASLLLNSNLDVLVFRGKTDPYISIDSGAASLNVSRIVRKELRPVIQTAVYRAKKENKDINETARLVQENVKKTVNIQIKPVKLPKNEDLFFLVLFTEPTERKLSTHMTEKTKSQNEKENAKDQQIKELSEDLDSTKLTLQTVIEQQEATNEELRSAMEEVQSSNEELMSTNEELETSREELQSANEELTTLNEELKNRNQNLSQMNDDLANLMRNVDYAVVIVDQNFRIRRFNNAAKELLRLMPSDVDIPITSIRLGIPIEGLENLLMKATSLETIRKEIENGKGRWYQMRVRPYLTGEKKTTGLVISFADVTEIKNLEDKVKVVSTFTRHDVRNKLMAVKGNIYLAKKHAEEPHEAEKYLDQIPNEMAKIDRILDVSKSYEMLGRQELTSVDVGRSVDDAASLFTDLKGVKIINDVRGFKLLADQMLSTLFGNLIDNTLKYSAKATWIRISAEKQTNGSINLIYEDDGVGISYEDKKRLFELGYGKGSGLGLFLIKRTCEIYGWTVTENGEPGKGARFVFEIPKDISP